MLGFEGHMFALGLLATLLVRCNIVSAVTFVDNSGVLSEIPFSRINANDVISIDVSHNVISDVQFFPYMATLYHLDMANNELTLFLDLTNVSHSVTELSLRYNHISLVHADRLQILINLIELDLSGNQIISPFPDMNPVRGSRLEVLHLTSNNLTEFPRLPVIGSTLRLLYVGHQSLDSPTPEQMAMFPALELLAAKNTSMIRLPDLRGIATKPAVEILLGDNALSRLDRNVMAHVEHGNWSISFRSNNISTIPNLMNLDIEGNMKFGGNPVVCDCHLRWIKVAAGRTGVKTATLTCAAPPALSATAFNDVTMNDLVCDGSTRTTSISAFDISVVTKRMPPINDVIKVTDRMDCATRCLSEDACLVFAFRITPGGPECALTNALDMTNGVRGAPSGEWGNSDVRWYLTDT